MARFGRTILSLMVTSTSPFTSKIELTRNQIRGFWASWSGWALDGMGSFIYALVLVPALRELLPHSGIAVTAGNTGFYGGLLFAIFLMGWGAALLWGPVADRFGRARTLFLTIVCYAVFALLCAFAHNIWELAVYRFMAGLGIGGEWAMGGTFVAEEWPEQRRKSGAGLMHTGYYFGFFLAAIANHFIGETYGWRAMFIAGAVPSLLVGYLMWGVSEPARWKAQKVQVSSRRASGFLGEIFQPPFRRRTIINSLCVLVSIIGLWAGSVYVPASVNEIAGRTGVGASAPRIATYATMLLSVGTILGCLPMAWLAERYGRRKALASYFVLTGASIALGFGYAFYLPQHAMACFIVALFFLGFGGASFAVYTLWLPEQYPTECRGSAFAFATSVGRFVGAGFTFLVGAGVAHFHTIGVPVSLTSIAFLVGLLFVPFGYETKGHVLPE
jgi:MFS family permease